jgi:cell wall assembly regulator SMI1
MTTPVFGDFLGQASDHISAAVSDLPVLADDAQAGVTRELGGLVAVLISHLSDMIPTAEFGHPTPKLTPELRAVLDTRIALRYAAQSLRPPVTADQGISAGDTHPASWHLSSAAAYLAAGRDLLHTHFASSPDGIWSHTSPWAAALKSCPVNTALLAHIGGIAARLAPWTAGISLGSSAAPGAPPPALYLASKWLWKAGSQAAAFCRQQPGLPEGQLVLAAIPANLPPVHRPLTGTESIPELCECAITSAERIRHAAARSARHARWSRDATSATWRRDALASAITAHSSEVIVRALAQRAASLGLDPLFQTRLENSATALKDVWAAWRAVTGEWDLLSTGASRGKVTSHMATEIGDLVLRIGRIAYRNPAWTPTCGDSSLARQAADLAPAAADLPTVLTAVHHATDTLTHVAATDRRCVRSAAADGRLYIATRLLTADYDIPYPYTPAPPSRMEALLTGYDHVASACATATAALDGLALAAGAPSQALAIARRVSSADHAPHGHPDGQWHAPPAVAGPSSSSGIDQRRKHQIGDSLLVSRAATAGEAARPLPPKR